MVGFRIIDGGRRPGASSSKLGSDRPRLRRVETGMTAPAPIRRCRTESFEHTISGLLTKRADLFGEATKIRDRLAEIKNDVAALDRVLVSLGYEGDLDAEMPRQKRQVMFGSGELTLGIVDTLREAGTAMTSRQIAQTILTLSGTDARDRRLMADHTKRVSKALRVLTLRGRVVRSNDDLSRVVWKLASSR